MTILHAKRFLLWLLRVANYDFCPSCNRLVYWLREPVGWVVTAIVFSLLVGLMIGSQGYVLAAAFSAFLVLGLAWPWISLKGVRCSLVLPQERVSEGEEVGVVFRVKNFWPLPVFGMMIKGDFLQESEPDAEPIVFSLKHVPAWSETEFKIKITPQRRGRLPTGDVTVSNGFPFGLVDVLKVVNRCESVLVWPNRRSLEGFPPACSNGFSLRGALVDRSGNDGDTIGVRCYRNGDRLRSIHWAQSARFQRLMTRERQKAVTSRAMVVMDLQPDHHRGIATRSSFECVIRIAATLCNHLHQSGTAVNLVILGLSSEITNAVDNRSGISAVFDFLAELPTLESAGAIKLTKVNAGTASSELSANRYLTFSGRKFLIGTDRADVMEVGKSVGFQPIVVQVKSFACELEEDGDLRSASDFHDLPVAGDSDTSISIVDLNHAVGQFVDGWNGRYMHVG